ncbi:unnamed protein product [Tuber melanosporum]|uniref:(Perigord truffle) hypothetical protein n=1 Tax=Tuber melanosporum (strain Mel28) TaxID=656061 RepID=D5G6W6_TUBMM|nr:uncharacterized protein GSTUM_00002214001 [Tuber melanosporum]CAZ80259.1 unnamed protein product [Tuber melanosporum]
MRISCLQRYLRTIRTLIIGPATGGLIIGWAFLAAIQRIVWSGSQGKVVYRRPPPDFDQLDLVEL